MIQFCVSLDVDASAARLIDAISAVPMGLVAHINGQANAAKRGITVAADQILEVFRPDFAVRVWQADKRAGIDIPLRIHLYAVADYTVVAMRSPVEVFAAYANPQLDAIAAELVPIFDTILAALTAYRLE
jgi:uncharacterized protein (DUF302 family)